MKTEQFSRIERLTGTTYDEIDKLHDGLNILQQLPEIVSINILSHIERDLSKCLELLKVVNDTIAVITRCLYG